MWLYSQTDRRKSQNLNRDDTEELQRCFGTELDHVQQNEYLR